MSINQSHPDDQVDQCLSSLQGEVENFILRMAAEFPQRREQLVFLINNYDMMLSVLTVSFLKVIFEDFWLPDPFNTFQHACNIEKLGIGPGNEAMFFYVLAN